MKNTKNGLETTTNTSIPRMSRSVAVGITLAAASAFGACASQPQPECFTYQKREVCSEVAKDTAQYRHGGYHGGHVYYYGSGGQRVYVPQSELPAVGSAHQNARSLGIMTGPRGSTAGRPYSGSTVRGGFGGVGRGGGLA